MGVVCTAHERVELVRARKVSDLTDADYAEIDEHGYVLLYNLGPFVERGDGMSEGIYRGSGKVLRWEASYGGYDQFREVLCRSVLGVEPRDVWNDYSRYETKPFAPLIHFADNEGFLGPLTCARLARDAATTIVPLDDFNWPTWVAMFELAAAFGVIRYS